MYVLVACEYSGRVRDAFTAAGHYAVSCDLLPTQRPGKHYHGNVLDILHLPWDLLIAHPPCTYLTCAAEWAYGDGPYHQKVKPGTLVGAARRQARVEAADFVEQLWTSRVPKIAIENPRGVLARRIGPAAQTIQPYDFGDDASKATCLWLKGLPLIEPTDFCPPRVIGYASRWANQTDSGQNNVSPGQDRWMERSTTYPGIADALSARWGKH